MQEPENVFISSDGGNLPPSETFSALFERPGVRVERIVSTGGHASPPGFWYDQAEDEWVLVLSGTARIAFDDGRELTLGPGDHVTLPAHQRHRVSWTDPATPTVWLAVFTAAAD
ncbi:MAG: cupin domain-containing protein [Bauldia sp.]|nr:cupin domain-containing protein [Bauldia sp.]